jgi:hypothetical protein
VQGATLFESDLRYIMDAAASADRGASNSYAVVFITISELQSTDPQLFALAHKIPLMVPNDAERLAFLSNLIARSPTFDKPSSDVLKLMQEVTSMNDAAKAAFKTKSDASKTTESGFRLMGPERDYAEAKLQMYSFPAGDDAVRNYGFTIHMLFRFLAMLEADVKTSALYQESCPIFTTSFKSYGRPSAVSSEKRCREELLRVRQLQKPIGPWIIDAAVVQRVKDKMQTAGLLLSNSTLELLLYEEQLQRIKGM